MLSGVRRRYWVSCVSSSSRSSFALRNAVGVYSPGVAMAKHRVSSPDDWPALGQPNFVAGQGTHVRFDTASPMERDDVLAPTREVPRPRGVPRPRSDHNPGFRNDQPRFYPSPRGGEPHFSQRGRGRGRGNGNQFNPSNPRAASVLSPPREAAARGVEQRQWVNNSSNDSTSSDSEEEKNFRVMSYNVLAETNANEHHDLYRGVSPELLSPNRRKLVLFQEISLLSPDIFALQECELEFFKYFEEAFSEDYKGIHAPRGGGKKDGCSVFFRVEKFSYHSHCSIDFEKVENGLKSNAACIVTLGLRDGVSGFRNTTTGTVSGASNMTTDNTEKGAASLRQKTETREFVVLGCIHGLFNPKRGDYKLGQMRVFLEMIEERRRIVGGSVMDGPEGYTGSTGSTGSGSLLESGSKPVKVGSNPVKTKAHAVITGDFNCVPSSPLYHFLLNGSIDISRVDRRYLAGVLAQGEKNGGDDASDEFQMLLETGGFVRDDEDWAVWDETRGAGKNSIKNALGRLREYFWDDEGVATALGKPFAVQNTSGTQNGNYFLTHALAGNLKSCYQTTLRDEPPVTSMHAKFKGTVDYIFHTPGLKTKRVLLPPRKVKNDALPTEEFASDHFCVVADIVVSS